MTDRAALVFLLDVDNTLFDNDRFATELSAHLDRCSGTAERARYWSLYAQPVPAPVPPDLCIARIGDLIDVDPGAFQNAGHR
jgi:hypothetical protein